MRFALKRGPEALAVEIAGRELGVAVRRSRRARRLILRIDSASGLPVLTLPSHTSLKEGERFLLRHTGWIAARLADRPAGKPFADGGLLPLRGRACKIVHVGGRSTAWLAESSEALELLVAGDIRYLPRRVADFLKREARRDFSAVVARPAEKLGRAPPKIRLGDATSRWGSCSTSGALAFSWRLVLAPPDVLDYLAAHEVAHLREMNHGPRFWALVGELVPGFRTQRAWLKHHGAELHAYGRSLT